MTDVDAAAGTVRATVEVALPRDEAFRVFTAEAGAWYVVDRHTVADHRRTVDIRFEPGVGGRFVDVYDAATGEGREMGRITVWDPPHRLVFVDARDTETEVGFAERPPVAGVEHTAVTIEQRGLDRLPEDVADHVRRYGWPLLAGWFADAVSGRKEEHAMSTTDVHTRGDAAGRHAVPVLRRCRRRARLAGPGASGSSRRCATSTPTARCARARCASATPRSSSAATSPSPGTARACS